MFLFILQVSGGSRTSSLGGPLGWPWFSVGWHKCSFIGGTENASTENVSRRDGIRKYGKPKYEIARVENVSMENSSTDMHGWNTENASTCLQR